MRPELKERWLEALKSGKYPKGTGELCSHGHFCCLGVLAEVAKDSLECTDYEVKYNGHNTMTIVNKFRAGTNTEMLPNQLLSQLGIHLPLAQQLATLNDQVDDFGPVIAEIERIVQ